MKKLGKGSDYTFSQERWPESIWKDVWLHLLLGGNTNQIDNEISFHTKMTRIKKTDNRSIDKNVEKLKAYWEILNGTSSCFGKHSGSSSDN